MTGSEILARARSVWPMWTVPYDMGVLRGGYRTDCSGYVSLVLGIPASGDGRWGGENTVGLVRWLDEIDASDLAPGDIVGCLGPGTEGAAGHVVIFEQWLNDDPDDNRYYCLEQSGDGPGPRRSLRTYGYDGLPGYRAYRVKGMGGAVDLDYTDRWVRPKLVGDRPARVELDDVWAGEHGQGTHGTVSDRTKKINAIAEGVKALVERPAGEVNLSPEDRAAIVAELAAALAPDITAAVKLALREGTG